MLTKKRDGQVDESRRLPGFGQLVLAAALPCLAPAGAAVAQATAEPEDVRVSVVEEVTVTARRREENLQDTPISIAAFTADALEARNVQNAADLGDFTPNMQFDNAAPLSNSNSASSIFIRGIGQTDFTLNIDPGVGLYVDGVYVARSLGGNLDVLDIERIEVLRGPQGTLFGRNTIGGAIVVTSKQPSAEFGGSVGVTLGSDERLDVKGSVNVPFGDKLFGRFSAAKLDRDGYVQRLQTGEWTGDVDRLIGRGALHWEPTGKLTFDLVVDGTRVREQGAGATGLAAVETSSFGGFHNRFVAGAPCVPPPSPRTDPNCFNDQFLTASAFQSNGTFPVVSDLDIHGAALTVQLDVGALTLKSISSLRELDSFTSRDADHSPLAIAGTSVDLEQEQISQELQVQGNFFDDRLDLTAGVYYFGEKGTDRNNVYFSTVQVLSGGSVDNDALAAFAQSTLDITPQLHLTGGVRYTDETKRFSPDQVVTGATFPASVTFPPGTRVLPLGEVSRDAEDVSPLASLAYDWTDDLMTYVTYSQGFRSGGFTQRVFPPRSTVPSFEPEYVETYEIGAKATLFGERVRLNGAAFYTDYQDLQVNVLDGAATTTQNAAAAEIKGFEIELVAVPIEGLQIEAGVGHLDAKYTKVAAIALLDIDDELVNTPEWSGALGVSYEIPIGRLGFLTPRVDWSYRSEVFNDAPNTLLIRQEGYGLLNASLRFATADGRTVLTLSGRNLTDEEYITSGFADLTTQGIAEATYGRPAEWALSISREF